MNNLNKKLRLGIAVLVFLNSTLPPAVQAVRPQQALLGNDSAAVRKSLEAVLPYAFINEIQWAKAGEPKNGPFVVLLQDAHGNLQAQKNIASVLVELGKRFPQITVGIEGAEGAFNFSWYRRFPGKESLRQEVGRHLLEKGWFTGAEYAGVCSLPFMKAYGVEEKGYYLKHLRAYNEARQTAQAAESIYGRLALAASVIKSDLLNPQLKELMDWRYNFETGKINLLAYYNYLAPLSQHPIFIQDSIDHPLQALFDHIRQLEASAESVLMKSKLEKESANIVKQISQLGKLIKLNLSAEEWYEYNKEQISMENIERQLGSCGVALDLRNSDKEALAAHIKNCEDYYSAGIERDTVATKIFLSHCQKSSPVGSSVLILGGFHTAGFLKVIKQAGFNGVVLTPKINAQAKINRSHWPDFETENSEEESFFRATPHSLMFPSATHPIISTAKSKTVNKLYATLLSALYLYEHRRQSNLIQESDRLLSLNIHIDQAQMDPQKLQYDMEFEGCRARVTIKPDDDLSASPAPYTAKFVGRTVSLASDPSIAGLMSLWENRIDVNDIMVRKKAERAETIALAILFIAELMRWVESGNPANAQNATMSAQSAERLVLQVFEKSTLNPAEIMEYLSEYHFSQSNQRVVEEQLQTFSDSSHGYNVQTYLLKLGLNMWPEEITAIVSERMGKIFDQLHPRVLIVREWLVADLLAKQNVRRLLRTVLGIFNNCGIEEAVAQHQNLNDALLAEGGGQRALNESLKKWEGDRGSLWFAAPIARDLFAGCARAVLLLPPLMFASMLINQPPHVIRELYKASFDEERDKLLWAVSVILRDEFFFSEFLRWLKNDDDEVSIGILNALKNHALESRLLSELLLKSTLTESEQNQSEELIKKGVLLNVQTTLQIKDTSAERRGLNRWLEHWQNLDQVNENVGVLTLMSVWENIFESDQHFNFKRAFAAEIKVLEICYLLMTAVKHLHQDFREEEFLSKLVECSEQLVLIIYTRTFDLESWVVSGWLSNFDLLGTDLILTKKIVKIFNGSHQRPFLSLSLDDEVMDSVGRLVARLCARTYTPGGWTDAVPFAQTIKTYYYELLIRSAHYFGSSWIVSLQQKSQQSILFWRKPKATLPEAVNEKEINEVIRFLVQEKMRSGYWNYEEWQEAFTLAIQNNCPDIFRLLVAAMSADVQFPQTLSDLLLKSAQVPQVEFVEICLQAGANIQYVNSGGNSALHFAAKTHHSLAVLDKLLSAGANVNALNRKGQNPLYYAFSFHNREAIKKLLGHGATLLFNEPFLMMHLLVLYELSEVELATLFLAQSPEFIAALFSAMVPTNSEQLQKADNALRLVLRNNSSSLTNPLSVSIDSNRMAAHKNDSKELSALCLNPYRTLTQDQRMRELSRMGTMLEWGALVKIKYSLERMDTSEVYRDLNQLRLVSKYFRTQVSGFTEDEETKSGGNVLANGKFNRLPDEMFNHIIRQISGDLIMGRNLYPRSVSAGQVDSLIQSHTNFIAHHPAFSFWQGMALMSFWPKTSDVLVRRNMEKAETLGTIVVFMATLENINNSPLRSIQNLALLLCNSIVRFYGLPGNEKTISLQFLKLKNNKQSKLVQESISRVAQAAALFHHPLQSNWVRNVFEHILMIFMNEGLAKANNFHHQINVYQHLSQLNYAENLPIPEPFISNNMIEEQIVSRLFNQQH